MNQNHVTKIVDAKLQLYVPQTSTPLKIPAGFIEKMTYVNESSRDGNDNQGEHYMVKDEALSKGTRFLSTKAVSILNHWFQENRDYPYPDEATTDFLAKQAEISAKQVKKWFANKRVRSQMCCKPMNRNKRKSLNTNEDSHELKQTKPLKKENTFLHSRDNLRNVLVKDTNLQTAFGNSPRYNSSPSINYQQTQNQNTMFATFIQEQYARQEYNHPQSSRLASSDQQKNAWKMPSTPKLPNTINSTKARQLALNNMSSKLFQNNSSNFEPIHQQNTPSMNTTQFNNALLLRSMSYLNPMLIMNILAAQSNLLNSSSQLASKSTADLSKTLSANYIHGQEFVKDAIDNDEDIYRNSSSSASSNRSTSSSSHNEYENSEVNDEKIENISVGSYENCNYSSENLDALKSERMNKSESFSKHKINECNENCNVKLEKLDSTSESGSSSSASNYIENNSSLINSNLSPCSLSSSSYASSSSLVENNFNFAKNKSASEKKTNFAVISSLI